MSLVNCLRQATLSESDRTELETRTRQFTEAGAEPDVAAQKAVATMIAEAKAEKAQIQAIIQENLEQYREEMAKADEYRELKEQEAAAEAAVSEAEAKPEVEEAVPAEQPAEPSDEKIKQKVRLASAFANAYRDERSFKTIREARAFAAEIMGEPVKPGTPEAKLVDEMAELGTVIAARDMLVDRDRNNDLTHKQWAGILTDLYNRQPTVATKTSTSVAQQAYSTPIPIAYVASELAQITEKDVVFEPSAGNGALLIEASDETTVVNELNPERAENLRIIGFDLVAENDATTWPEKDRTNWADVVIANPPFGAVKERGVSKEFKITERYSTTQIDHAIALHALESMKDGGRAVLIVAGVNAEDQAKRSDGYNGRQKRAFYLSLYQAYNVVDHFTIAGELYAKQGAGWPIDVIVIQGRGKSSRALPAVDVPRIYNSYPELVRVLDADYLQAGPREPAGVGAPAPIEPAGGRPAGGRPDIGGRRPGAEAREPEPGGRVPEPPGAPPRGPAPTGAEPGPRAAEPTEPTRRPGPGDRGAGERGGRPEPTPVQQPEDVGAPIGDRGAGAEPAEAPGERPVRGEAGLREAEPAPVGGRPDEAVQRTKAVTLSETTQQVPYAPASKSGTIGTLVPVNMVTATQQALENLQNEVGEIDAYVAEKLDYKVKEIGKYFAAEQLDAVALAIYQMERGAGMITGDQTGIGKGREVAALIRYALKHGKTPIFVTKAPNLYADMMRDLTHIGMSGMNPLMTNNATTIPLEEIKLPPLKTQGAAQHTAKLRKAMSDAALGEHDMIFTTYSQMQTVKGAKTVRQEFLEAFAPGAIIVVDESHEAGGTGQKELFGKPVEELTRAKFTRDLLSHADGVFYSSATYAKRPEVMDLYAKTDMRLAVNNDLEALPEAIRAGGVPLQQVVATMLTEAGQYIRRERDFTGILYNTPLVKVDRKMANAMSEIMRAIQKFDETKTDALKDLKEQVKADAKSVMADGSTGAAGISSTNFTSIMHNIIDQMLLALKADAAVEHATKALEAGKKPVITVANTMGAFIESYSKDMGLNPGDAIDLQFNNLMMRYLERSRDVIVGDAFGKKDRRRLTDEELGPGGVAHYKRIQDLIRDTDLSSIPVSPIDYVKWKLKAAGYEVGEITGRTHIVDYSPATGPEYRTRGGRETSWAARRRTIDGFNAGKLDAIVLNQAGSTGLSLHASETFKDQKPRHLMVAQPEKNIDTHMQILGRVNRTGQVELPEYSQFVADIPAEKRPAAVLAKKMASLNANTTASKDSAVTAKDVPDFMNEFGDEVVATIMEENPDIHLKLGAPLKKAEKGPGLNRDGAMRRATGRIPLLPLQEQEDLYDYIESEYADYIERLEAMGESTLEAKTLDLDARTLERTKIFEPLSDVESPFTQGAYAEKVDVKRIGKPYTSEQVLGHMATRLGLEATADFSDINAAGQDHQRELIRDVQEDFNAYSAEILDDIDNPEKRKAQERRLEAMYDRLNGLMRRYWIGTRVRLKTDQGNFFGFVTNFERKGRAKNPAALGSWRITFEVADAMRRLQLSANKVYPEGYTDPTTGEVIAERTAGEYGGEKRILQLFDEGQTESREKRTIVTGNLLAGYGRFPKGRIINYTDNRGEMHQGIIMPKDWELDTALEEEPVLLPTADIILKFIEDGTGGNGIVWTHNKVVSVRKERYQDTFVVSVPSSKAQGGRYFLDDRLIAAAGQDFIKRGSYMQVRGDADMVRRMVKALQTDLNESFVATEYRAEARKLTGISLKAEAVEPDTKYAYKRDLRAEHQNYLLAFARDERNRNKKPLTLEKWLHEQPKQVSRPRVANAEVTKHVKMILSQIAPQAKLNVVDRYFGAGPALKRSGAATMDRMEVAGAYEAAENLITVSLGLGDPVNTVKHEALHALREMGFFTETEWTTLEAEAPAWKKQYGVSDTEEAVANAFGDFRHGKRYAAGIRGLFQRMMNFFVRIGNMLRGRGYQTAEDIFERAATGEVAQREPDVNEIPPLDLTTIIPDFNTPRIQNAIAKDLTQIKYSLGRAKAKPQVAVEARQESGDINPLMRALWTGDAAWGQRYPPLKGLYDFAVTVDLELSKTNRRFKQDYHAIKKPLKTEEWNRLTDLVWFGDANAVELSRDEVLQMGYSQKIADSYMAFRKLIYKMGRFVDQHRRSMVPKYRTRKAAVLRRMRTLRNMSDFEFRSLYGKRTRLRAKLRQGKGNPEEIQKQLEAIDGELQVRREQTGEFEELLQEADRMEAALAKTSVRRRAGYAPHKFFGTYSVYRIEQEMVVDEETGEERLETVHKLVAGEEGFYPSLNDAVRAANEVAKADPDAELLVRPVQFMFPNSQATTLTDGSYWKLTKVLGDALGLRGADLSDAMRGIARRRFRRRIAGFAQFRKGIEGYSRDLDRVMQGHIGEVTRYVWLDKLKYRAINDMEAMGLSPFRSAQQKYPTLQAMVEAYMRDMNGQKQAMEASIDEILDKPWARPAIVGAAGAASVATPLLVGVSSNPAIGLLLGSYVGWRLYRSLSKAGDFKIRAVTGAMVSDMTHAKLGMLFNVMSAVVNLTQTIINTLPVLGPKYTMIGINRLQEAVRSRIKGKPNADWRRLERADVVSSYRYADTGSHQFDLESTLSFYSLLFFNSAEQFNRAVAYLGGHKLLKDQGKSEGDAHRMAEKDYMLRTQHNYGPSNKPELLRNVLLRVPFQFKNFMFQQIAFTWWLGQKAMGGEQVGPHSGKTALGIHLTSLLLVAGALGLPFVGILNLLIWALFDWQPVEEMKAWALRNQAKGNLRGPLTNILVRGAATIFGEDMAMRVGQGDKFLPESMRDLKGPWWSTVENAIRLGELNATIGDQLRNVTTGLGRPFKSMEAAANGMPMQDAILRPTTFWEAMVDGKIDYTNPWKNGYTEFDETEITPTDLWRMAVGSTPTKVAERRDIQQIGRTMKQKDRRKTKRYVNQILTAVRRYENDPEKLTEVLNNIGARIAEDEFIVDGDAIRGQVEQGMRPRLQRYMKHVPRKLRPEIYEMVQPLMEPEEARP